MRVHHTAFRHGISLEAIEHALRHSLIVVVLNLEDDPPRVLAIGPDHSGILVEVVSLALDDGNFVIHAMRLRPSYRRLLPDMGTQDD